MPVIIRGEGADRVGEVARALKQAGQNDIYKGMVQGIRSSVRPAVDDLREVVRSLPIQGQGTGGRGGAVRARTLHALSRRRSKRVLTGAAYERLYRRIRARSGLRESVARAIQLNIQPASKPVAVVKIRIRSSMMPPGQQKLPNLLNRGHWRHPVFGNREVWVGQTSRARWFQDTLRRRGPHVRAAIDKSVTDVLGKL